MAIRDILHTNIDVHSRKLIDEFPVDGIKCIEKLKSHCANMTFSEKSRYDRIFQQVIHKGGKSVMNYIKIHQCTRFWITFTKAYNVLLKLIYNRQS